MLFSKCKLEQDCPQRVPINDPLWLFKQDRTQLKVLEGGDVYTFKSQSQQNPNSMTGLIFPESCFQFYEHLPEDLYAHTIFGDTAQKTEERHDFSVFQLWARSSGTGDIYLIDQVRGKWEAPALEVNLIKFWNKHKRTKFKPKGAEGVVIEHGSSGTSLIQSIRNERIIPISGVHRSKDKHQRVMAVIKFFNMGRIWLPMQKDHPWMGDYLNEFREFTSEMTHKHDDQIDPTIDAVDNLVVFNDALQQMNARSMS